MPAFPFSQALTANQKNFNPISGWQMERVPMSWGRAAIRILVRTTAAAGTVQMSVFTGTTTIQQQAPMSVGGTAGVQPTEFNTPPIDFLGDPDDRLLIQITETAGATPTVDGIVIVERAA